jgi:hypothetical protein
MNNNKDYIERFIIQDQKVNKRLKPLNNTPLMIGSNCQ